jgi:hypothetical protein
MSPEMLIPIVASIAWLILAGSALASHRLGWGQMIRMALAWLVIFMGLFVAVEWFMLARGTAGALL